MEWSTVIDALTLAEGAPADASGLVQFGDAGAMLVENRRICWVVAAGLQRRLTDLLAGEARLQGIDLDEIHVQAQLQNRPLGQLLVQDNLLHAAALDRALRRHSAESLRILAADAAPLAWRPHQGPGYAPRFTYLPEDVLFDVVELELGALREAGIATLARCDSPEVAAAAFLIDVDADFGVPVARVGEPRGLASLAVADGRARLLSRAGRELEATPRYVLAEHAEGFTVVWWGSQLVYVASSTQRGAIARITAQIFRDEAPR